MVPKIRQFKESFMEAILDFMQFLSLFIGFLFLKSRSATIKLSLNCLKLCKMSFFDNMPHVKKVTAKNSKVECFGSHTVCIGMIFKKSNGACVKVSLNHINRVAIHSGNFSIIENIRETQTILIFFLTQGIYDYFFNLQENFKVFKKILGKTFSRSRMRFS